MQGRENPEQRIPRAAVWGSLGLHVVVLSVVIGFSVSSTPPLTAQTYQVRLIAAADLQAPIRETPAPPRQAEEENRPPPPQPTDDPLPQTELPSVVEEIPQVDEPVTEPARADETGEEAVTSISEGLRFIDPAYLANVKRQILRYFRPPDKALQAEVMFVIERSGEVRDIKMIRRSGSAAFDLDARGAIEAAARADAFGPLPAAYPFDELPISFFFDPSSL